MKSSESFWGNSLKYSRGSPGRSSVRIAIWIAGWTYGTYSVKPLKEFYEEHLETYPRKTAERYFRTIPVIIPGTTVWQNSRRKAGRIMTASSGIT